MKKSLFLPDQMVKKLHLYEDAEWDRSNISPEIPAEMLKSLHAIVDAGIVDPKTLRKTWESHIMHDAAHGNLKPLGDLASAAVEHLQELGIHSTSMTPELAASAFQSGNREGILTFASLTSNLVHIGKQVFNKVLPLPTLYHWLAACAYFALTISGLYKHPDYMNNGEFMTATNISDVDTPYIHEVLQHDYLLTMYLAAFLEALIEKPGLSSGRLSVDQLYNTLKPEIDKQLPELKK